MDLDLERIIDRDLEVDRDLDLDLDLDHDFDRDVDSCLKRSCDDLRGDLRDRGGERPLDGSNFSVLRTCPCLSRFKGSLSFFHCLFLFAAGLLFLSK